RVLGEQVGVRLRFFGGDDLDRHRAVTRRDEAGGRLLGGRRLGLPHLEHDLEILVGLRAERVQHNRLVVVLEPLLDPFTGRGQHDPAAVDPLAVDRPQPHLEVVRLDSAFEGAERVFPQNIVHAARPPSALAGIRQKTTHRIIHIVDKSTERLHAENYLRIMRWSLETPSVSLVHFGLSPVLIRNRRSAIRSFIKRVFGWQGQKNGFREMARIVEKTPAQRSGNSGLCTGPLPAGRKSARILWEKTSAPVTRRAGPRTARICAHESENSSVKRRIAPFWAPGNLILTRSDPVAMTRPSNRSTEESRREAHLSAAQQAPQARAWFPQAHGQQGRPTHASAPSPQRPPP